MADHASLDDPSAEPHVRPLDPGEPQVIRLTLAAGECVAPHSHPERAIVLVLLSGRMKLDLGDETHALEPRDVIRFDGQQEVSPRAIEDSKALLVLARRV